MTNRSFSGGDRHFHKDGRPRTMTGKTISVVQTYEGSNRFMLSMRRLAQEPGWTPSPNQSRTIWNISKEERSRSETRTCSS